MAVPKFGFTEPVMKFMEGYNYQKTDKKLTWRSGVPVPSKPPLFP